MTVYKYFLKLAYRNKTLILIYTGLYMLLSLINGLGIKNETMEYTDIAISIGAIDESQSDISNGMLDYLDRKNRVEKVDLEYEEIKEELFLERYDAIIVFPEDFKDRFLNGEDKIIEVFKDPKSIYTINLEKQIDKYLSFLRAMEEKEGYNISKLAGVLERETRVNIVGDNGISTSIENWFNNYFNQASYMIILVFLSIFGKLMLDFKNENLNMRVSISSKSVFQYNKELYLAQLTLAGLLTSLYILVPVLWKREFLSMIDMKKYIINIILFSFSILGLAFFINNFIKNTFMINGISTLLSLGVSFISGAFVQQEFLSEGTLKLARFFPSYYYIKVNNMKVDSLLDVRKELFVLVLFGIVYFLLGVYFSRDMKLEENNI